MKELHLSVHDVVDFLLRKGDIDNRVFNKSSMQEGTLLHSLYQSKQDKGNYLSEYPLKDNLFVSGVNIFLEGRADGIIINKDGYTIDELKTTVIDLDTYRKENLDWHLGQAKLYAFMFMKEKELAKIGIQLTYIKQGNIKERLIDSYLFNYEELSIYADSLLEEYISFYNIIFRHYEFKERSINELRFPFNRFRKGQQQLAKSIYDNISDNQVMFIEAPTGIGKTISAVFSAIKHMRDDLESKVFYLTAKNSGKSIANDAISLLKEKGLDIYSITLTAKEKICLCKEGNCNPDECPFARGYFNKIQEVIRYSLLNYHQFDLATILNIANENQICPFEFQLDLSLFCDFIICDYNYLFDPISYLQRYFEDSNTNHIVLIDEAHNLVDRSRDMYSASISTEAIYKAKKSLKGFKSRRYKSSINNLLEIMESYELEDEQENLLVDNFSSMFFTRLNRFLTLHKELSADKDIKLPSEATDLFIDCNKFLKISDFFADNYIAYVSSYGKYYSFNYYCLDASRYLKESYKKIRSATLFSATLSPIDYFISVLGGEVEDKSLILDSPFNPNHFKLLVAPKLSVKYKNREQTYELVVSYIYTYINSRMGNYFIYVPSYEYLEKIKELLIDEDINLLVQEKDMDDIQKEEFINTFSANPVKTTVGLAVLGGAFSEGIDLVSDRLIGVVVIGIGLPKLNFNSDNIRAYYVNNGENGYQYAYINPGINKITQAIGRVIRSENDYGSALLIDERYTQVRYRKLFNKKYPNNEIVLDENDIEKTMKRFYKQ